MKIKQPKQPKIDEKKLFQQNPEFREIIKDKIEEFKLKAQVLELLIKLDVMIVDLAAHQQNKWFWLEVIKQFQVKDLLKFDDDIDRLESLLVKPNPKQDQREQEWERRKEAAREMPIENVVRLNFKPSGSNHLIALCPFHNEKTPSFMVDQNDNHYHCFGCQKHGDIIKLVEELYHMSFKEAVNFLTGK